MKIALIHDVKLPVATYGGTERVIWWLSKGLNELGNSVTLVCRPGSTSPYAKIFNPAPGDLESQLPDVDVFHYFLTPEKMPTRPYLVSIGGNGKPGEIFLPNTVFVSRDHAARHHSQSFVYNGVDPDEYIYRERKSASLLFLAKASWKVKNVKGAIRIAKRAKRDLHILGGSKRFLNHWRGIHWEGMLGGKPKAEFLANAAALLWPILWEEPFGLAVVEAFMSGTPVLANRRGSVPEMIPPACGAICESEDDYAVALENLAQFRAKDCRDWAVSRFHYRKMAENYGKFYAQVTGSGA